jgi:hypothetical protein
MESFKTSIQHLRVQITQEEHKRDIAKGSFSSAIGKMKSIVLVAMLRMMASSTTLVLIACFVPRFDLIRSLLYESIWFFFVLVSMALIVRGTRYMALFVGIDAWKKYKQIIIEKNYTAPEIAALYATYRQHITRLREMRKALRRIQKEYAVYKQNMRLRAQEYLVVNCRDTELKEYLLSVLK